MAHSFPGAAWEAVATFLASWPPSDLSWSQRLPKESKKSIQYQSLSELNGIGRNPVEWTVRCTEDSGARSWCPTLVIAGTRRQSTCCPVAWCSSSTASRNLKMLLMCNTHCCDCSHRLLQETRSHCGKSNLAGHQSHQSQCQPAQQRKWIESLWHIVFVLNHKTTKICIYGINWKQNSWSILKNSAI